MASWIDDADCYRCPVCGYETHNPRNHGYKCPKCGFVADEDREKVGENMDYEALKNDIVTWIREYFSKNGNTCSAVVGISGGKDSSIVAALCVEALGKERVVGVLMPNGKQDDICDSYKVVEELGIRHITVDIGDVYAKLVVAIGGSMPCWVSKQAAINLPPRIRMATLYAVAQSIDGGGRVANTCNASEDYVGYSTKYGDSAGDFSPLRNITVRNVIGVGDTLPISKYLVHKIPADGLCGKTDEDNFGFTYDQLDDHIETGSCGVDRIDELIERMRSKNMHKLLPIPSFRYGGLL